MSRPAFLAATIAAAFALGACEVQPAGNGAEQAKGPPPAAFPPMEKEQGEEVTRDSVRLASAQDGERMFMRRCGVCHLEGGMGTMVLARRLPPDQAPLAARRDINRELVFNAVREGTGSMPRLTRTDVTDAELNAIAAYLARPR